MADEKKPASPGLLGWLFGTKQETPAEAEARKKKEDSERRAREAIQNAIKGYGKLKEVAADAKKANEERAKRNGQK